jgi:hypothetical protein
VRDRKPRFVIVWRGHAVGFICEPRVEMWEIYGRWDPIPGEHTQQFLRAVAASEEETVSVGVSEQELSEAEIFSVPTAKISARLKPR